MVRAQTRKSSPKPSHWHQQILLSTQHTQVNIVRHASARFTNAHLCYIAYRDSSLHKNFFHCSTVQWRRYLHHSKRRWAFVLMINGFWTAAWPWKSSPITFRLIDLRTWAPTELLCNSWQSWMTNVSHRAFQNSEVPIGQFLGPTGVIIGLSTSLTFPLYSKLTNTGYGHI